MNTKNPTDKKRNPLITYLKGAREELKKVTWPSKKETWKKSWIVIWFSLGFTIFLGLSDYVFNKIIEIVI